MYASFSLADVCININTYVYVRHVCVCVSWQALKIKHVPEQWCDSGTARARRRGPLSGRCPDRWSTQRLDLDLSSRSAVSRVLRGLFHSANAVRLRSFSAGLKIDRQKYGQHGEWDPLCKTGDFHVLPLPNTPLHAAYFRQPPLKMSPSAQGARRETCPPLPQGNERQ